MNAWAAHTVVHAALISNNSAAAIPVIGSASLYSFALGASVAVLVLTVARSPRQLHLPWRPADIWQSVVRSGRLAVRRRPRRLPKHAAARRLTTGYRR